jgi:hypothetical protein
MNTKELSQKRFGRLVAIKKTGTKKRTNFLWECICDCGNKKLVASTLLITGRVKSCGCLWKDKICRKTHGKSKTPEYKAWSSMKNRCKKDSIHKKNYYDRGIYVCDRWSNKNGFLNFLSDVGKRPSCFHSLDRINNDCAYSPENVRWATIEIQNKNRRIPKSITSFSDDEIIKELKRRNIIK